MGANAQTTVPTFTAGNVLSAAEMNQSARTGVPVFADSTARDAAFGGTGEKTLAEGQLCYLENSNIVQYYDGSNWATVGPQTITAPGLELITAQTIGTTVSTVTVSNAFSATYENYRIIISGGVGSTNMTLSLQIGNAATGYYAAQTATTYAGAANLSGLANGASFTLAGTATASNISFAGDVFTPQTAKPTGFASYVIDQRTNASGGIYAGYLANTNQYTDFTIATSTGTLTGGIIRVYGYKN